MNPNSKIVFATDFIDVLIETQNEAERLGFKKIFDILIFKNLIGYSRSYLKDFLQYVGVNLVDASKAAQQQLELYLAENQIPKADENGEDDKEEKADISMANDMVDWDIVQSFVNLSHETVETISNSAYYSYSGDCIGEIEYILALVEEGFNSYVEGFFRLINKDTRAVSRYFSGLMAEKNLEFEGEGYVGSKDDNDDDYNDIPAVEFIPTEEISEGIAAGEGIIENKPSKDKKIIIPSFLRSFLDFVEVDTTKPSPIRGRAKETLAVIKVLLKSKKCNAVLVGEPGVGKTAIIEYLTWLIETGNCPEELKSKKVITLDVNSIIAGAKYVGMAEERFDELTKFLKRQKDVIVFIDEMHTIVGAGSYENNTMDLANALKPLLARGEVAIVGATTNAEYENWMCKDKALKRRFEKIEIKEPEYSEVYPMIKGQIDNLEAYHGVKISKKMVDYIIKVAGCFSFETANPDRTLDMADKAMATAKMQGKKTVTMSILMSNFDVNFKDYNRMSNELKFGTAYHELGHYLVRRYSKHICLEKVLAISIIPAEDYLGITVRDNANRNMINWTYEAYIESIAALVAGRVAEKMYSSSCSSGADSDLERATQIAKDMLLKYGLSANFSKRNVENDRSEKQTEALNKEIDKIIDEGYKLATSILKDNKEVLDELAVILCKKGILVGNDLETICRNVEKSVMEKKEN